MVERIVRDDIPNYDLWGYVHPDLAPPRDRWGAVPAQSGPHRRAGRDRGSRRPTSAYAPMPRMPRSATARSSRDTDSPRVRHFFLMRRPNLDDIPDVPTPGRPDRSGPSDRRTIARSGTPRTRRSAITGAPTSIRSTSSRSRSAGPSWTRTCGSSPGTAIRSRASSRPGSGRRRTRRSASAGVGSRRSASADRGVSADWDEPSRRPPWGSSGTRA